jgi:replicative DNA helicase
MASIDVTVDVDIEEYLDEVDDQDLADELLNRGWFVADKEYQPQEDLTDEEMDDILEKYYRSIPGTLGYDIYEKLRYEKLRKR